MKTLLLISLALVFPFYSISQEQTYTFDDGTKVTAEVINNNPDNARKLAIIPLGLYNIEGGQMIAASFYSPTKFYASAMVGPNSFMVEGNYFFINQLKDCPIKQSVKDVYSGRNSITSYVIKVPAEKRISYGIHTGISNTSYTYNSLEVTPNYNYSTMGAVIGITRIGVKQAHWKIEKKKELKGSSLVRLNADAVFYFNQKKVNENEPLSITPNTFGYRLYYDGQFTLWGGKFSFKYMLGLKHDSYTKKFAELFAGLGAGFSFL